MVLRVALVSAESPTIKTNFSQIARRTSALISASIPARVHASSNAAARSERLPSNSPNTNLCIVPVWRITPGRAIPAPM